MAGEIDAIIKNALASCEQWAENLKASAQGASAAAETILQQARTRIEVLKQYAEDLRTGSLFQAEKVLVDDIDFDSFGNLGGQHGEPIREIQVRFPQVDLTQVLYRRPLGEESREPALRGRYRILLVLQKMAPPRKDDDHGKAD